MFTVKLINHRLTENDCNLVTGYEAASFHIDRELQRVTFETPIGESKSFRFDGNTYDGYQQIVVENAAGKTIENLRSHKVEQVNDPAEAA